MKYCRNDGCDNISHRRGYCRACYTAGDTDDKEPIVVGINIEHVPDAVFKQINFIRKGR